MNRLKKSILAAIFILHFFMIGLYLFPGGPLRDLTSSVTSFYVNPLFRQNWHMFAPMPLTFSSRLIVKCPGDSDWIDPTADLLGKHTKFPMIHLQKSIFIFNSISQTILDLRSDFKNESKCGEKSLAYCEETFKSWIQNTDAYKKASEVGKQVCGAEHVQQLGVFIEHAKPFSEKYKIPNQGTEILELDK